MPPSPNKLHPLFLWPNPSSTSVYPYLLWFSWPTHRSLPSQHVQTVCQISILLVFPGTTKLPLIHSFLTLFSITHPRTFSLTFPYSYSYFLSFVPVKSAVATVDRRWFVCDKSLGFYGHGKTLGAKNEPNQYVERIPWIETRTRDRVLDQSDNGWARRTSTTGQTNVENGNPESRFERSKVAQNKKQHLHFIKK